MRAGCESEQVSSKKLRVYGFCMRSRPFQLGTQHRAVLYLVFGILFLSGLMWWVADEAMEEAKGTVAWAEEAKPWLLRVHGGAAMVFLVVLGTVLMAHARRAWAAGVNRWTGLWLGSVFCLQAVTGYGLFYFSGENLREWTGTIHISVGLILPAFLVAHILWGRRIQKGDKT